jgi:hypothetical protein
MIIPEESKIVSPVNPISANTEFNNISPKLKISNLLVEDN